jgi:hypothetical protein
VLALNQSYSYSGQVNCESSTAGSSFADHPTAIGIGSAGAGGGFDTGNPCD